MPRCVWIVTAAIAAGSLFGCSPSLPGTGRTLGAVNYETAFAAGRRVMSQYFSVLPGGAESGLLQTRPMSAKAGPAGGIGLGSADRRKVATLRLSRRGEVVMAHLSIQVQGQRKDVFRQLRHDDQAYTSVPNQTPAQEEAATTPEQNDVWRNVGRDRKLERQILGEIYQALHPPTAKPPAKGEGK